MNIFIALLNNANISVEVHYEKYCNNLYKLIFNLHTNCVYSDQNSLSSCALKLRSNVG